MAVAAALQALCGPAKGRAHSPAPGVVDRQQRLCRRFVRNVSADVREAPFADAFPSAPGDADSESFNQIIIVEVISRFNCPRRNITIFPVAVSEE